MTVLGLGPWFLVGFMGCGKSAIGQELARRTGLQHRDTDLEIEAALGCSIPEIFASRGEQAFRAAELEQLERIGKAQKTWVSTGGGAFLRRSSRARMQQLGVTVWLDASLESCRRRLGNGAGRPLWPGGDPLAQRLLYERRRAAYALARVRVPADGDPGEVATRVAEILGTIR